MNLPPLSDAHNTDLSGPQVRSRVTVVCTECKRLKLKCDRRTPCGSCTKRDTVARCVYSPAALEKVDLHTVDNRLIQVESQLAQFTTSSGTAAKGGVNPHFLNSRSIQVESQLAQLTAPSPGLQIRPRVTVVCTECKRLRLKCDRRTPCGSCTKRDTVSRCVYSSSAVEKIDLYTLNDRLTQIESQLFQFTTPSSGAAAKGNPHFLNDRPIQVESQLAQLTTASPGLQRITIVCTECKRLRLKCDRRAPCGSCTKRDTVARCVYSSSALEKVDLYTLNSRLLQVESQLFQFITSSSGAAAKGSIDPHFLNNRPIQVESQLAQLTAPSPGLQRVTVVCIECKRLKLKCDRRAPCGSCTKRDTVARCVYVDLYTLNDRLTQIESRLAQFIPDPNPFLCRSFYMLID